MRSLNLQHSAAVLVGLFAVLCGAPVEAAFTYKPSPKAILGTIDGIDIAIDVRTRADQMGNYVQLVVLQRVDQTQWDYAGNLPVKDRMPKPEYGNAGQVWELNTSSMTIYRSPAMTEAQSGDVTTIFSTQGAAMIGDWVPKMNALLATLYAPGRPAPTLKEAPPAPAPPHFTGWQDARDYVAAQLAEYQLRNGQIVPKGTPTGPAKAPR